MLSQITRLLYILALKVCCLLYAAQNCLPGHFYIIKTTGDTLSSQIGNFNWLFHKCDFDIYKWYTLHDTDDVEECNRCRL